MPGEHAKLSPSAAHRWKACPASVRESESAVESDTEHSLRGTAVHWAYAEWLAAGDAPEVGRAAPNGVVLTQEMLEVAGECVGWVRAYLAQNPGSRVLVESRVQIGEHFGLDPALFWGTCDTAVLAPSELVVLDLKAGWVDVQAEENEQLVSYATGLCHELGWLWDRLRLVIVQPAQGEPKEWVVTREELRERAEELREPIQNALSGSPRYGPTEGGCRYCPAAARCQALHDEALALARREFDAPPEEVARRLTTEQVAELLQKRDLIRGVLAAVEEHALRLLQLGRDVPGFKVVEGKKNRVWVAGAEERLAALLGERAYVRKLVSPAQAEKLARREVLEGLSEKPRGEPRLAPLSDKRPALPPAFDEVDMSGPLG